MQRSRIRFGAFPAVPPVAASLALGQTVPPATREEVDKLIAVLKSEAPQKEKSDACRQLGVVGTKEAVPALAALLGDERLSHMARYGLEPIPDASVDDALRDALGKLKGRPLVGVMASIGVRRDFKAVEPLIRLLDEADPDVVRVAAGSLGKIATPEAAAALEKRLAGAPPALRGFVADGCMACAERLLEGGKAPAAVALYEAVSRAEVAKHVRLAAAQAAAKAR